MLSAPFFSSSPVLQLCNQPLFTFTAKVNYRFQQAACRGSGSKQKCLTAGAERGAAADRYTRLQRGYGFCFLFLLMVFFHLTGAAFQPISPNMSFHI